jgi:hypothetical protein
VEPEDPDVLPASLWLCGLAVTLKREGFDFEDNPSIFNAMAKEIKGLKDLTFASIPSTGKVLPMTPLGPEPFQGMNAQPNVFEKK